MEEQKKRRLFTWPTAIALVVIVLVVMFALSDNFRYMARGEDNPPEVDFTWSPIGKVTLQEMVGHIHIKDDYALDFSTFEVRVVELDKTIEIFRDDVIGREYDGDVSFAIYHENPILLKYGRMTLEIKVADDRGQETRIERVVKIKRPEGYIGSFDVPYND